MEWLEKFKDLLMPEVIEEEEYEEEELAEAAAEPVRASMGRAVNGGPVPTFPSMPAAQPTRPKLTVHTNAVAELAVDIYVPSDFNQVQRIADDLMAKKATIVNYERVEASVQRRISDFLNGVCYTLDGEARRISDNMALYVPNGVNVTTVKTRPVKA